MARKNPMSETRKAVVYVRLKPGVLDPQGVTIHKALLQMGYPEFKSVRSGRFFELEYEADDASAGKRLEEICRKLLANPVVETFSVEPLE